MTRLKHGVLRRHRAFRFRCGSPSTLRSVNDGLRRSLAVCWGSMDPRLQEQIPSPVAVPTKEPLVGELVVGQKIILTGLNLRTTFQPVKLDRGWSPFLGGSHSRSLSKATTSNNLPSTRTAGKSAASFATYGPRITVAFTRASDGLVVVGHRAFIMKSSPELARLLEAA